MFDLDHFKSINDRFGHALGDEVLRVFGQVVRTSTRADDIIARFGGEEFIAIVPGGPESASKIGERVRSSFEFAGATVPPTLLAPPSASARLSLTSRSRHLIPCSRARMRCCTVRNTPAETASMWPKKKWRTSGLVSSPRPAAQSRQAPSLLRDGRGAKRHSDVDFKSPPNPPRRNVSFTLFAVRCGHAGYGKPFRDAFA